MRVLAALFVLVSMLTTHAAALERALVKALGVDGGPVAVMAVVDEDAGARAFIPHSESASESDAGPCAKKGDCVFLVPAHAIEARMLIPARGLERQGHLRHHHGRGVERPPIS